MSPTNLNLLKSRFMTGSLKNLVLTIFSMIALLTVISVVLYTVQDESVRFGLAGLILLICGLMFWALMRTYKILNQKYFQLKQFILDFNTPEATIITTASGIIEWKSPSFLKSFANLANIQSIEELFMRISTPEERPHLLAACKNLNAENPDFDKTVWLQEEPQTQRILVKGRYLAHNQTTVWTWIKLDSIQKILLEDFLISDSSEDFLRSVQFKDLYDAAPAGDVLLDSEGHIIHYNRSFEQNFLRDEPLARNAGFIHMVAEEDIETVTKRLEHNTDRSPFEFRLKWGIEVVAYANKFPYRSLKTGQMVNGLFVQLFDNTEQKIKQQRLIQSQKTQALGLLTGGIAHDFNNLLTAMIGFCDLVLSRYSVTDQSFNDVMQIKRNANRGANLVRQLLAFSRQQALQPKILDVTEILKDLSILLQRLIGQSIQLKFIQEGDIGIVKVDESQFEQVIINLVVNARDAIENKGEIFIRTYNKSIELPLHLGHEVIKPGNYVVVEVEDTGSGIPPESLSHIFDPFYSTKEVGSGTGLGLATVQGIINQTGGYIDIESTVGKGTKFIIYLPQHQGEFLSAPQLSVLKEDAPVHGQEARGKGTILLVEDEDAVRLFSARALKSKGYQVLEASTGEEGYNLLLELYEQEKPPVDLLITDVVMPVMDGPTLARKAHKIFPDLKIIFMSGYAEDSFRQKLGEGQIQFLPKPFSLQELAEKTKDVLSPWVNSSQVIPHQSAG